MIINSTFFNGPELPFCSNHPSGFSVMFSSVPFTTRARARAQDGGYPPTTPYPKTLSEDLPGTKRSKHVSTEHVGRAASYTASCLFEAKKPLAPTDRRPKASIKTRQALKARTPVTPISSLPSRPYFMLNLKTPGSTRAQICTAHVKSERDSRRRRSLRQQTRIASKSSCTGGAAASPTEIYTPAGQNDASFTNNSAAEHAGGRCRGLYEFIKRLNHYAPVRFNQRQHRREKQ